MDNSELKCPNCKEPVGNVEKGKTEIECQRCGNKFSIAKPQNYDPAKDKRASRDMLWILALSLLIWVQAGANFDFWIGFAAALFLFCIGMIASKRNQKKLAASLYEPETRMLRIKRLALPIATYLILAVLVFANAPHEPEIKMVDSADSTNVAKDTVPAKPVTMWSYTKNKDRMTGQTIYHASTSSIEELKFEFPYNGGSTLSLNLRSGVKGNEVMLSIDKGQFMSNLLNDEFVKFKFDNGKPINYGYNGASDGSSDVIFIRNSSELISKLRKCDTLLIEAPFFNEGRRVAEFWTAGLEWPH